MYVYDGYFKTYKNVYKDENSLKSLTKKRHYPQPDNGNAARCSHNSNFAKKQHKCSDTVNSNNSQNIACENTKRLSIKVINFYTLNCRHSHIHNKKFSWTK